MSVPEIVSRQEWLDARKALLAKEKELTRQSDALNAARRKLPMVKVEKEYGFDGPGGPVGLLDLFQWRRQLVVYHFMFDPEWDAGCPGCTAVVDEMAPGRGAHLHSRGTSFAVVSRAPLEKLEAYKAARGWTIDWHSSYGSDFNYDFGVTLDASVAPILFNYRDADELANTANTWATQSESQPVEKSGLSFFLRDGDDVFHTYSTYGNRALAGVSSLSGGLVVTIRSRFSSARVSRQNRATQSFARSAIPDTSPVVRSEPPERS